MPRETDTDATARSATELAPGGLAYPEYRDQIARNADVFDAAYEDPRLEPGDLEWLGQLPPLHIVAVVGDWCPDVAHTLPTWQRVVEALPGWSLGIYDRDAHPEVMASFRWHTGAERVPVYAFYHERKLQTWWSARSTAAEEALQEQLRGRAYGDLDEAERRRLGEWFGASYTERFRRLNFEEIVRLLACFFHRQPPSTLRDRV